jgi:AsmA family protein
VAQGLIIPLRRALIVLAVILAVSVAAVLGFAAAADAGLLRGALVRLIARRVGRPIEVAGSLEVHLLSRYPRITAERVTVGNPAWVAPGRTAEIGELSLVAAWPRFRRPLGVTSVTLRSATLYLMRNAAGRANWQWTSPDENSGAAPLPIVRIVSIDNAHVILDDERRHLKFDGTVSVGDSPESDAALRIRGEGRLNGRAASFEITGDALAGANHELPYHFSFTERSGGSQLSGKGLLPRPFDFNLIDTAFEASGPDLKDLYFLVGVTLINTGSYRLSGNLERRGNLTKFGDLSIASGQSDARGTLSIDSSGKRPRLDVDLKSQVLRMADLGERAAGQAADVPASLMLSDAPLSAEALRRSDARLTFHAGRVDAGRLSLDKVSAKGTLEHGLLTVAPLLADILRGNLEAHVTLDAQRDPPAADADIKIEKLQLADIHRKNSGAAPIEGPLDARIKITGRGSSIHQVAASGNGSVTVVMPQGEIRDSLAELTGIDLRGLGLLLSKDQHDTPLRCAVGSFTERDGTLSAQRLIADTEPVLIIGEGRLDLKSEQLDFLLRGYPKSPRFFRFRSPVHVKGTLLKPAFGIEARRLQVIDPGRAKDEDCAALIAAPQRESP